MAKLKPKWIKTNIPKATKIKLWLAMMDNVTYPTWKIHLENHPEIYGKDDEQYKILSRDTYQLLQQEIREIPAYEVLTLPEILQDWILEFRPDLVRKIKPFDEEIVRLLVELKNQLVVQAPEPLGGYDVIFPTHFTEDDRKPRRNHIRGTLCWRINDDLSVEAWFPIEDEECFSRLREVIQNQEIWQAFSELKQLLSTSIQNTSSSKTTSSIGGKAATLAIKIANVIDELI